MPIVTEDPLRKYDSDDFSFKKMKGEVSEAMTFDWKRDKVDDAKKRAIGTSATYQVFKDRVAGCTLKPIHRNEFNSAPKYNFNTKYPDEAGYGTAKPDVHRISASSQDTATKAMKQEASIFTQKVPRNGHEFERELRRRLTFEDKMLLLDLVLEQGLVAKLFSQELDGETLRSLLTAFEESPPSGIARRFFGTLVVECPVSITTACSFLDKEERITIARLLAREPGADRGEDVRVCAAFGIPMFIMDAASADAAKARSAEEPEAASTVPAADDSSAIAAATATPAAAPEDADIGGMD